MLGIIANNRCEFRAGGVHYWGTGFLPGFVLQIS